MIVWRPALGGARTTPGISGIAAEVCTGETSVRQKVANPVATGVRPSCVPRETEERTV